MSQQLLFKFRAFISGHKSEFWLVGVEDSLDWLPHSWKHIHLWKIMRYLGILFGIVLFVSYMEVLSGETATQQWQYKDPPFASNLIVFLRSCKPFMCIMFLPGFKAILNSLCWKSFFGPFYGLSMEGKEVFLWFPRAYAFCQNEKVDQCL